jgi:hypothetical protein
MAGLKKPRADAKRSSSTGEPHIWHPDRALRFQTASAYAGKAASKERACHCPPELGGSPCRPASQPHALPIPPHLDPAATDLHVTPPPSFVLGPVEENDAAFGIEAAPKSLTSLLAQQPGRRHRDRTQQLGQRIVVMTIGQREVAPWPQREPGVRPDHCQHLVHRPHVACPGLFAMRDSPKDAVERLAKPHGVLQALPAKSRRPVQSDRPAPMRPPVEQATGSEPVQHILRLNKALRRISLEPIPPRCSRGRSPGAAVRSIASTTATASVSAARLRFTCAARTRAAPPARLPPRVSPSSSGA